MRAMPMASLRSLLLIRLFSAALAWAGVNADDRQPKLLERPKTGRRRAALEPDADRLRRIGSNEVGHRLR